MKWIAIDNDDLHLSLKVHCAQCKITLGSAVEEAVRKWLLARGVEVPE